MSDDVDFGVFEWKLHVAINKKKKIRKENKKYI